jgi:hypothetical protein
MVMGYKNAPMLFQRIINKALSGLISKGVEVYLDEVLVYAKTKERHDTLLMEVFRRLRENKMVTRSNLHGGG